MADQEAGGEQRDRAEQRGNGVALIEELDRQDRGQAPENIEIIPFDDVSSGRGSDHGPEVLRNSGSFCYCAHLEPPVCGYFSKPYEAQLLAALRRPSESRLADARPPIAGLRKVLKNRHKR